jgi:hypothetical protein
MNQVGNITGVNLREPSIRAEKDSSSLTNK